MNLDRAVLVFAGSMVLLSLGLSRLLSASWIWLTVWVGVMLFQAGLTRFCPAAYLFKTLGVKPGSVFR